MIEFLVTVVEVAMGVSLAVWLCDTIERIRRKQWRRRNPK